ncbi:unnamed protein product [Protopolystoma xenopodis]|uniref:Uncharacterized protein n=1 Tax=Protopolystoma xenopodis TaxID=117903 RepID=A0A3S5AS82_9PLAT|nr:unnamed protein product [Protopolystoma xenopodis]
MQDELRCLPLPVPSTKRERDSNSGPKAVSFTNLRQATGSAQLPYKLAYLVVTS